MAADGFPSGHDSPEGAACDLARSFINRDEKLFASTSVRLFGGGKGPEAYAKFLRETVESIKAEAAKKEPSLQAPKSIGKVFAARHLTKPGPVSYGYASFGFEDIMFVDVGVYLNNGGALHESDLSHQRQGWQVVRARRSVCFAAAQRRTQRSECIVSGFQRRPQPRELADLGETSKHRLMRNQEALPAFAERPRTTSTCSAGSEAGT